MTLRSKKLQQSFRLIITALIAIVCFQGTCRYSLKDAAPIPPEIKTVKVFFH